MTDEIENVTVQNKRTTLKKKHHGAENHLKVLISGNQQINSGDIIWMLKHLERFLKNIVAARCYVLPC